MIKEKFRSKKEIILICSMLLVFVISLSISINADAAEKQLIKLEDGHAYLSYNIKDNPSGKNDCLRVDSYSDHFTIWLDEKYTWYWEDEIGYIPYRGYIDKTNFYLYLLSDGSKYIGVSAINDVGNEIFHSIFKYIPGEEYYAYYDEPPRRRPGKFVKALDVTKLLKGSISGMGSTSYPVKVSGNTITIKFNTGITSSGIYDFNVNYRPSGNKLKATEDKYKLTLKNKSNGSKSKTFKVLKKFKTYKKVGSKKVSYTTKVGEKLKVVKICPKSKNAYVLLKRTSGKTGWVNFKKLSYKNVK